ncbi:hypothetical protein [Bartonella doshiae]|nr:hypothetical protein [Bartonella doshiae]
MDKDIVVLTADSRISGKIDHFAKCYPTCIVEVGIADNKETEAVIFSA